MCTKASASAENALLGDKFEVTSALKEKLKEMPDILELIQSLQKYIARQRKRIKKLKAKIKSKIKTKTDIGTQTNSNKSISEEITEAATMALSKAGLVFEETSGMYYDYNTGYYYNAEYGLYYDGNTGTYMTYDQEKQTYEFHSQVEVTKSSLVAKVKEAKRKKIPEHEQAPKKRRKAQGSDLEEGECSDSSQQAVHSSEDEHIEEDAGNQWPPCMRIIIEDTAVPKLKIGSLHIVTFEGGTVGREGDHSIIIPDINISKHHLKLHYDKEANKYMATDLGSRNGTVLNGKRMATSKQESEAMEVAHGSRMQLGSTMLLCHIHVSNQTCGHCEPGLIMRIEDKKETNYNKTQQHKTELKQLRKKFGIGPCTPASVLSADYTDRAQVRRETVGSQNHNEKTEVASVNESIASSNKGFKLLAKMGWSEGQSLGKNNEGLLEPINQVSNCGTTGLGNAAEVALKELDMTVKNKSKKWTKAQERYEKIAANPEPIFEDLLD